MRTAAEARLAAYRSSRATWLDACGLEELRGGEGTAQARSRELGEENNDDGHRQNMERLVAVRQGRNRRGRGVQEEGDDERELLDMTRGRGREEIDEAEGSTTQSTTIHADCVVTA